MGYGKITAKQQEILDYIKDEILKRGYPPTVREICETVNLKSTSSVHSHLETLEKNGYIRRDPTKPRAIEICDDNFQMVRTEMVSLPVIGNVAAGQPILAEENVQDYFPVPADVVPKGESFILNVRGESMINAGIHNGDLLIVDRSLTPVPGDVVAAVMDDEIAIKRLVSRAGITILHAENPRYPDYMPSNGASPAIWGIVTDVIHPLISSSDRRTTASANTSTPTTLVPAC